MKEVYGKRNTKTGRRSEPEPDLFLDYTGMSSGSLSWNETLQAYKVVLTPARCIQTKLNFLAMTFLARLTLLSNVHTRNS
jgi:hypothetical protein